MHFTFLCMFITRMLHVANEFSVEPLKQAVPRSSMKNWNIKLTRNNWVTINCVSGVLYWYFCTCHVTIYYDFFISVCRHVLQCVKTQKDETFRDLSFPLPMCFFLLVSKMK